MPLRRTNGRSPGDQGETPGASLQLNEQRSTARPKFHWIHIYSHRPKILSLVLFYIAYLSAAGFGQALALIPGGVTLWPPGGLLLAMLILRPAYSWPWWLIAGGAAELTGNVIWFHNPVMVALAIIVGNALAATLGASLVNRFRKTRTQLESLEEVLALIVFGAGIAPIISASIGSAALDLSAIQPFRSVWPLWWVGDATGILIFTPLFLVVLQAWRDEAALSTPRVVEAVTLGMVLIGIGTLALSGHVPFAFIIMPPLLWAAARFEFKGAVAALILLAALTAVFAIFDLGEFSGDPVSNLPKSVMLHLFLAISALSALVVAAISRENHKSLRQLRASNEDLESRVAQRTEELRASEVRYRHLFEQSIDGLFVVDAQGRCSDVSPSGHEMLGMSREEVLERRFADLLAPDEHGRFSAAIANITQGEIHRGEWRFQRKDGSIFVGELAGRRLSDGRFQAVLNDITERKEAGDRLRESEAKFRGIFDAIFEFAGHMTPDGRLLSANRASLEAAGIEDESQVVGAYFWETPWWAPFPEEQKKCRDAVRRAAQGEFVRFETRYRHHDGTDAWSDVSITPVRDSAGRIIFLVPEGRDITILKQKEEHVRVLMRELNHRAKNILAVVHAVARQTIKNDPDEFLNRFEQRINALSASHDLLVGNDWKGAPIKAIVRSQLAHLADHVGTRIVLNGPHAEINARAAQSLGMALHELSTNAVKYGSLSNETGSVEICWGLRKDATGDRFAITWAEHGGPQVTAPSRRGFGSTVIEPLMRNSLDASVEIDYTADGLRWRLDCPDNHVLLHPAASEKRADGEPTANQVAQQAGKRILVVEDEMLLALDLAAALEREGYHVVGPAATVQRALDLITQLGCDCAVLDVQLAAETSEPIAARLASDGVPFIIVSGYARAQQAATYQAAPFIAKPFSQEQVLAEIRRSLSGGSA